MTPGGRSGGTTRRFAAMFAVVAVLAAGCGTRASDEEIRAGVSSGPVSLDQASVDQLRSAAAGAPVVAGAPGGTLPGAPPAIGSAPVGGAATTPGRAVAPGTNGSTATVPAAGNSPAPASGGPCTTAGAPLHLGQIGSFSGVFGPLTGTAKTATAVWVAKVNAAGGLACHPVVLHSADDGGDPSKGSALIGELVSKFAVQAFLGVVSLALPGELQAFEKTKLPVVGGDMVSDPWFTNPQFFPQGGGLQAIIDGALKQAVENNKTVHGLLYCVEVGVCTSVAQMLPERAKVVGAKIVYSSPVSLTQTDFTAQCQNAKNAGVQAFGMAVDGSAIARVARSCAALNYYPQFVTGGGVVSSAQAKDPGIQHNTMSTASSNAPWMLTDTPGQKEYAAALARYAPGMETDGPSMIGWSAGKLFEALVRNLGDAARAKPITTADIYAGLGRIKNDTLDGLSPPLTFSPGQKAAPQLHCVYFELDTDKGWTAPHGSTPICTGGK